jgi:hypothetical protein
MSLLPECYQWSQRAIVALDETTGGGAEEMQLQASLGVASMLIHGPSEAAGAALNRSLAIAERRSDVLSQVVMLRTLSLLCTRRAEFKNALDHATRARAVAATSEDPDANALAQSALGMSLHFMGDLIGARSELETPFQHWSTTRRTYLGIDERTSQIRCWLLSALNFAFEQFASLDICRSFLSGYGIRGIRGLLARPGARPGLISSGVRGADG